MGFANNVFPTHLIPQLGEYTEEYYKEDPPEGVYWIEDGHGSMWARCSTDCDLEVVRPGKVQCGGLWCNDLAGYEVDDFEYWDEEYAT